MVNRIENGMWRWIATTVFALLISISAYYVRANDKKWDDIDLWKQQQQQLDREVMIELQTRLVRIEEKLDTLRRERHVVQ